MARPRQARAHAVTAVPVHAAGVDALQYGPGACLVGREDTRRQAIARVVHQRQRFLVATHLLDADDGTEALFPHQLHAVVHLGENGGLEPVAGALDPLPSHAQRGTLGFGIRHLRRQHAQLRCARDRADIGVLGHRVPHLERAHRGQEGVDEGRVDALVHIDALDRAATLPGVVHGAVGQRLGGVFHVGVVAHIGRVLATQFELQLDHPRPYRRRDSGARPG